MGRRRSLCIAPGTESTPTRVSDYDADDDNDNDGDDDVLQETLTKVEGRAVQTKPQTKGTQAIPSTPALNSSSKGSCFCYGAILRSVGFQREEEMLPRPFQFPVYMGQLSTCNYTLKGFGEVCICSRSFFFFLSILPQVCSPSHLSMCHFPSTFPLMHLLKNNFQTLLVTRRDAEKEKRERELGKLYTLFDESKSLAVSFMTLCLWLTLGLFINL